MFLHIHSYTQIDTHLQDPGEGLVMRKHVVILYQITVKFDF